VLFSLFALFFFFLALYCIFYTVFRKNCTALIGNENWEIFSCILLKHEHDESKCRSLTGWNRTAPGMIISNHLTWSDQVNYVINKANRVLGIIKRTAGTSNTNVFMLLYKTLVRPILEYAVPMWSPYLVTRCKGLGKCTKKSLKDGVKSKTWRNALWNCDHVKF
jgi:hypothetical protein